MVSFPERQFLDRSRVGFHKTKGEGDMKAVKKGVSGVLLAAAVCGMTAAEAGGFWDACKRAGNEIANWNEVKIENHEKVACSLKEGVSFEKVVRQAAKECAETIRGSIDVSGAEGGLTCELRVRKHTATVLVTQDKTTFSVVYSSSVALNYDETKQTIHPNYNTWVKTLVEKIVSCAEAGRELSEEKSAAAPAQTTASAPAKTAESAKAEDADAGDAKTRLRRLQGLKDDGLITEEEFKTKRAEILKSI